MSWWVGKDSLLLCDSPLLFTLLPHSTFLTTDVWVFPPTPSNSLQHQLGSYNSIQFWYYLPGVSVRFHTLRAQSHKSFPLPTSDASRQVPVYHLYCWLTSYRLGFARSPSLGSVSMLEWLTELCKTVYILFTHLLWKDMIKDTGEHPDGRDA